MTAHDEAPRVLPTVGEIIVCYDAALAAERALADRLAKELEQQSGLTVGADAALAEWRERRGKA